MIRLLLNRLATLKDAQATLQTAIGVEFGTLPPYLYALYSIRPGANAQAQALIKSVVQQEMIHLCLASNILNALGGNPVLNPQTYPGPLPGDIGTGGTALTLHLYPFSSDAMKQAMAIEEPEKPPDIPARVLVRTVTAKTVTAKTVTAKTVTIGQFYQALDSFLATLPASDWKSDRNQIVDNQFFAGQLFAVNSYADAHQAIQDIVSEGEGTKKGTTQDPLDFQDELAHYYRFGEIFHARVLTKAGNPQGYTWGPGKISVDWSGVYPAITDPGVHDFSKDPAEAQAAQKACNQAFSVMVDALQRALSGKDGALGEAVKAMFALRLAALHAFTVPLADRSRVAGPAFLYKPVKLGAKS